MDATTVTLDLFDFEATTLRETPDSTLANLRMEIADADSISYRNELKRRKQAPMKIRASPD